MWSPEIFLGAPPPNPLWTVRIDHSRARAGSQRPWLYYHTADRFLQQLVNKPCNAPHTAKSAIVNEWPTRYVLGAKTLSRYCTAFQILFPFFSFALLKSSQWSIYDEEAKWQNENSHILLQDDISSLFAYTFF